MKTSHKVAIAGFLLVEILGLSVIWTNNAGRSPASGMFLCLTHIFALAVIVLIAGPLAQEIDK